MIMTSETFSPSAFHSIQARSQSLWRRFINAIMSSRQRKAEEFVREFLQHHSEYQDRAGELERWRRDE
jgi:hypothetical protein